jgi:hypothetical protein
MTSRRRVSGDEGTTLMELMVGMGVMSIAMAIFTTAIVSMFSSTSKTQAVVNSSAQLNTAFGRLDVQVRYASDIYQPTRPPTGQSTPYWSVIFQTDDPTSTTCRQLTIRPIGSTTVLNLVENTWTIPVNSDGSLLPPGPVSQSQLAAGVALVDQNGTAVTPFDVLEVPPAQGASGITVQRLHLQLVAVDGANKSKTRSFSEIWFSALNSAMPSTARSGGPTGKACELP